MYKKTITYTDYNGTQRTDDLYFNLSKAELTDMQIGEEGGMYEKLVDVQGSGNTSEMIKLFKEMILMSYGEKSDDGRTFRKFDRDGHRLADDFVQTEAYSELFMNLATHEDELNKFMQGILPQDIVTSEAMDQAMKDLENRKKNIPAPALK